jgi:perosamine synthetase
LFINIAKPDLTEIEREIMISSFDQKFISGSVNNLIDLDEEVLKLYNAKFISFTNSGTSALNAALEALPSDARDEVIIPSYSYIAPANAAKKAGLKVKLSDIDSITKKITLERLGEVISDKTKAVILTHTNGILGAEVEVYDYLREKKIIVIDDIAEAQFIVLNDGNLIGKNADIITNSYFANKVITCGEGGSVITKDPELREKVATIIDQGRKQDSKSMFNEVGYNFRLSAILKSILKGQFQRRDEMLKRRRSLAKFYKTLEFHSRCLPFDKEIDNNEGIWLYPIGFDSNEIRDEIYHKFIDAGIEVRKNFIPIHEQKWFKNNEISYKNSTNESEKGLLLPMSSAFSASELDFLKTKASEILH